MNQNFEPAFINYKEVTDNYTPGSSGGIERFLQYIKGLVGIESNIPRYSYPGLQATPWHNPDNFAFIERLETSYTIIKQELFNLRNKRGFQPEKQSLERTGSWKVFFLYERGKKNEENCYLCPETTKIVESIPSVRTMGGLIYFSAMTPGTYIHPHKGPTNIRLRCHLGLDIPDNCGIKVGEETRKWEEGKCLVFDDSFSHEAWNNGTKTRFVLIVDIWHPDLSDVEISALEGLHNYINFQSKQILRYWAMNRIGRSEIQDNDWWV
jgi:aspartate beta-hydroxylase